MIMGQDLSKLVSVGIATKNRWQDLEITLEKLDKNSFESIPIIIFDDASDLPCPFDIEQLKLNIKFKRFINSHGLIVRRNQLAQTIQTKYYLSLDDDSYPVSGSLQAAVEFAESRQDLLCVSFPIYNPVLGHYQSSSIKQIPYQVKSFIGCGHLLHIENFLKLGGYREELIHQGEEMEIAARAFQEGLHCYHFPSFEIHHTASNQGRNWHRMDFYGARNNVLWNDWFVPNELKLIKQSRTLISRIIHSIKVGRMGQIQGELAGLMELQRYKYYRITMSVEMFNNWQVLPFS
ncbi:MAG: glycosyltransferase family 2 protein [Moorea sp. SIO4A5]|nr:glycosyltransferase family 2 protein [Moorena sp. SIO4A5]